MNDRIARLFAICVILLIGFAFFGVCVFLLHAVSTLAQ